MILTLFEQFYSPALFGIPLILIALLAPGAFFPKALNRWIANRASASQGQGLSEFTRQIFISLNTPGHKWALMFASLMLYIIGLNMLGLLPYTFTPTTQLSVTLALALPAWLATVIIGFWNNPNFSLAHLLPEGTPLLLIPVLIIIETISLLIRPVALAVRLTANLTAGHLLVHLLSAGALVLLNTLPYTAALVTGTLFLLTMLETGVAMIQAYVFILLLSLYLQENT